MRIALAARYHLVVGVFALFVFLPDPGVSNTDRHNGARDIIALVNDERNATLSPTLKQNSDDQIRLFVFDKCRAEGERELQRMAYDSKLEESYAFLPLDCIWIELGSDETPTSVSSDTSIILSLAANHVPIVVYHTHVRSQSGQSKGFPAYQDLIGSVLIGGDLPLIEGRPIVHRAVTVDGIFQYSLALTPEVSSLIEGMKNSGLGGYVAQNLAYLYSGQLFRKTYYDMVATCLKSSEHSGKFAGDCFPMSSFPFLLKFVTSEEIDKLVSHLD